MAYNKVDYGGKTLIDLTGDTVTPETLAKGETAHDMTGAQIVGTMEGGGGDEPPVYTNYCAIYCAEDSSLTFVGTDLAMPQAGGTFKGMEITAVYTGLESTGKNNPPWYSSRTSFTSVLFDASFAGCKPTSCYEWFYEMTNCTAIDGLKYLDTSSATTMYWMFRRCSSLVRTDVSNWNTSSVTNMYQMFYNCSSLVRIDVSNWNTSSVTNMYQMFYNCSSLTTIYSDDTNFVTTAVTSGNSMFTDCTNLVGGNGTAYSSSHVDKSYAHIDTASNPGYFTDVAEKE